MLIHIFTTALLTPVTLFYNATILYLTLTK